MGKSNFIKNKIIVANAVFFWNFGLKQRDFCDTISLKISTARIREWKVIWEGK